MKELKAIQQAISVTKNQHNEFGKFNYRSCEDILVALKPLLEEQNATIYLTDSVQNCGDKLAYVQARVVFMVDGKEDMKITSQAQAGIDLNQKGMNLSQKFGSASSYARKYALAGLFLLDDNKDPDSQNNKDLEATAKEIIDNGDFL